VLRVSIDDASTHPGGGVCTRATAPGDECWNAFGVDLPVLSGSWQQHFLRFDEMTQKGPREVPGKLDSKRVYLISFKASPGNLFDVWIDDVGLFK
jgi:hypothetical protein